jgi:SAM-dependent methyltransferase
LICTQWGIGASHAWSCETYDELWSSDWGEIQRVGPVHRHVHEDAARVVGSLDVTSVLDAGCGSGDLLARLAAMGRYQLAGTDVSAGALELARRRAPAAQVELLDLERDALDRQFDLVLSIQVVEHLLDDLAAFRHLAAMSRRYVFVSTMKDRMRRSERDIGHVRNYSTSELEHKLRAAGLDVLWIRGWGFPFYSPLYRSAVEWLPGRPPVGEVGPFARGVAKLLYHLYKLNVPGHGDVVSALAAHRR